MELNAQIFFLSVINIYNVSSLNYLGLAKRLQVAKRSLTPVFSCRCEQGPVLWS